MATTRDIKRQIKSVASTQQITKAMNLVAASKLQRAKVRLTDTRPFFNETKDIIRNIVNNTDDLDHPYITVREVKRSLVIVITGDKGLCGGYNSNIIKLAMQTIAQKEEVAVAVTGNKGVEYLKGKNIAVAEQITGISDKPFYEDAAKIGRYAFNQFAAGKVDEVLLCYTVFQSTISHIPKVEKLLPVDLSQFEGEESAGSKIMAYEPNADTVLSYVIPKYINTVIFGAMVESAACELGARTTSMDSATKNAGERIEKMTILYNRARQGSITQEITEIVAGANALK